MLINPFKIDTVYAQVSRVATDKSSETLSFIQAAVEFLWLQVPRWIAAVIIIFGTFIAAKMVKNIVVSKMAEKGIDEDHQEISILAGRSTNALVLIVGITVGLKVGGIDLTAILAAVAFGIGFALRDLIMNFLAGAMILLSRQFTIGDSIKINDVIGKVVEIQTRATILKALDGTKVIVPNADLFTNQVISFTSNPFRRIEIMVGVEYDTNLQVAIDTVNKVISETSGILLEPKPSILIKEFADSSINITVRFWVESRSKWLSTKSNVIKNIKSAFDKVGIGIPFPIRTVYNAQERDAETFQKSQEDAFKSLPKKSPASTPTTPVEQSLPNTAPKAPSTTKSTTTAPTETVPKTTAQAPEDSSTPDGATTNAINPDSTNPTQASDAAITPIAAPNSTPSTVETDALSSTSQPESAPTVQPTLTTSQSEPTPTLQPVPTSEESAPTEPTEQSASQETPTQITQPPTETFNLENPTTPNQDSQEPPELNTAPQPSQG